MKFVLGIKSSTMKIECYIWKDSAVLETFDCMSLWTVISKLGLHRIAC